MHEDEVVEEGGGLGRRDLLKRGAALGGALVWTVPAVQTLAGPALANHGSAPPGGCALYFQGTFVSNIPGCAEIKPTDPHDTALCSDARTAYCQGFVAFLLFIAAGIASNRFTIAACPPGAQVYVCP